MVIPTMEDSQEEGDESQEEGDESRGEGDDSQRMEIPRGRRRFPEEGDAQGFPRGMPRRWRSREERDDSREEGDDSQRTKMPKDSRGECLEGEDARRLRMTGG